MTVKAPALVRGETNLDRIVTTINLLQANGADADSVSILNTSVSNNTSSIAILADSVSSAVSSVASLYSGQIPFPASQNPSTDVHTLDDYEEGTWTPALTCVTPGNLSVTLSEANGAYIKIGRLVYAAFGVTASSFTYTTASGLIRVTGLPFTADNNPSPMRFMSALNWGGITKAGYTDIVARVDGTTDYIVLSCSGSGVALSNIAVTDIPSGGNPTLRGSVLYLATN